MDLGLPYFSPTYKYFDQLLQKVKNKTTVLILIFKEFLQTSIPPLIFILYAGGCHDFLMKHFRLTVPKNFVEEPVCVSEKFGYLRTMHKRGISQMSIEKMLSHSTEKLHQGKLLFLKKFWFRKVIWMKRVYHVFPSNLFGLRVPKKFVAITSMFQKIWGIEKIYAY